jgi:protoheme IX farnesyltransferase
MAVKASTPRKSAEGGGVSAFFSDLLVLAKLRITFMVLVATAVGYLLGAGPFRDWGFLGIVILATFLLGAGVNALNQYMERNTDGLMRRTASRPLPTGRMRPKTALACGLGASALGVIMLWWVVNPLCGMIGGLVVVTYLLCYTPLKRLSGLNTLVGAVPGALPPVLGWAAGAEELGQGALALFLILFVWQPPHFLSIAHLYREDYATAGMPILTVVDPSGNAARRQLILYSATLIPVSMYPSMIGLTGEVYFFAALALSLGFLASAAALALRQTEERARLLLKVSVFYLPVLFAFMIYDARVF